MEQTTNKQKRQSGLIVKTIIKPIRGARRLKTSLDFRNATQLKLFLSAFGLILWTQCPKHFD